MPNTAASYLRMLEVQRAAAAQKGNSARVAVLNSQIASEIQRAANQRAANLEAAKAQGYPTSRKSRRSRRNRKHRGTTRRRT
jgi:competence protein ComGC